MSNKQTLRIAAALTAAAMALGGASLAAGTAGEDVLTYHFKGDVSSAEKYVDREARSVSDENYTLTVDSSVSDDWYAYLLVRMEARTPEAEARLTEEGADFLSCLSASSVVGGSKDEVRCEELLGFIQDKQSAVGWFRYDLADGASALRLRHDWMDGDSVLEIPLSPAPSVDLRPNAAAKGSWMTHTEDLDVKLKRVQLSPFALRITFQYLPGQGDATPAVLLRRKDGSLFSPARLSNSRSVSAPHYNDGIIEDGFCDVYLNAVLDLNQISGVVYGGKEYPLDGSAPKAVRVDESELPFAVARYGDRYISVRELCGKLGVPCLWDNQTQSAAVTYRGVTAVFTLNRESAAVDGEAVPIPPPLDDDGTLIISTRSLFKIWHLGTHGPITDKDGEPIGYIIVP